MKNTRQDLIKELKGMMKSLSKYDKDVSEVVGVEGLIGDLEETVFELESEEEGDDY